MMKIIVILAFVASGLSLNAQTDTTINGATFLANGNVGIGEASPGQPLAVIGSASFRDGQNLDILLGRPAGKNGIVLNYSGYSGYSRFNIINFPNSTTSRRYTLFSFNGTSGLAITKSGRIGIGTSNPLAKLHVKNGDNSYGAILANSTESAFGLYTKSLGRIANTEMFRLGLKYNESENNGFISFYRGSSSSGGFLGFSTNGNERIRITKNGNVGIGTASPDEKLVVDGSVRSEEVRVEVVGAPDYVFAPAYELITLKEVEDYIDENSHLPEIPSAIEMETNGVELGVMNMCLLKKIEELTLYTIDQEKRLLKQQEKIKTLEAQQAQIDVLAKELQALRKAIKKD